MQHGPHDRLWIELGNIDYLLDQLARGVERGEVAREVYDSLAPRYLMRRTELAAILSGGPPAAAPASAPAAGPATRPASASTPAPATVAPPRAPVSVNWTGVLTAVGSLLVIIASAIFAIATWDLFTLWFRIGFLGLLTIAFYGVGALVRSRLQLSAGGIALMAVGSAMLLFDGWIVIDGWGLEGPWPWVAWLAVCSAVYWGTEVAVAGRFFGVIGAAAQVAWIWLLGQGLGWTTAPRMAAVAAIAVAWTLAGRAGREREQLASLAQVLRWAGPLAVAIAVAGVVSDLGIGPAGWTEVLSTLVVAGAVTFIAETIGLPRGMAALAHAPVLLAVVSMQTVHGRDWWQVALLAAVTVGYLGYELMRGGWGHGIAAVAAELLGWYTVARIFDWPADVTVGVFAFLGAAYLVAARLIESAEDPGEYPGWRSAAGVSAAAGYLVLLGSTLAMPFAREVIPLLGMRVEARDAALAALVTLAWFAGGAARRETGAGLFVMAGTVWTAAATVAWLAPGWHSALYATVIVVVAALVMLARRPLERTQKVPPVLVDLSMRAVAAVAVPVGALASLALFDLRSWESAVMLAAGAGFWLLSAVGFERLRLGLAAVSAHAVLAVAVAAWWIADPHPQNGLVAVVAGAAAVLVAGSSVPVRERAGWGSAWPLGAAVAATAVLPAASLWPGPLAAALALTAFAWALVAFAAEPLVAAVAGVLAVASAVSACAWLDVHPWVTVAALSLVAGALLAPSALRLGGLTPRAERGLGALVAAGFGGPLTLLLLDAYSVSGLSVSRWAAIGEQGVVVALLVLGAYAIAAGLLYRAEPLIVAGGGALLVAAWAELAALDVTAIEPFSLALGLYITWIGYRIAKRTRSRPPLGADVAAALVILAPATLAAVGLGGTPDAWQHLVWALGLSLVAIGLGVMMRVRAYFFGGSAALVLLALGRSWVYLAEFWWLVLGLIGIVMLVIALTWERQRMLLQATSRRIGAAFGDWR